MTIEITECDFCGQAAMTGKISCINMRACAGCAAKIFNTTPEKVRAAWEAAEAERSEKGIFHGEAKNTWENRCS